MTTNNSKHANVSLLKSAEKALSSSTFKLSNLVFKLTKSVFESSVDVPIPGAHFRSLFF